MDRKLTRAEVEKAFEELKNWGRWGPDDQIGTLDFVRPEDIVAAARLIRRGRVFSLGIPLDRDGPQTGLFGGRWNPIHTMLATGTDAVAGNQDEHPKLRDADDAIHMPVQAAVPLHPSAPAPSGSGQAVAVAARRAGLRRPAGNCWPRPRDGADGAH